MIKLDSGSKIITLKNGIDFDFDRTNGPPFSGVVLGCCNYTYTITGKGNFCGQVDKVITVTPKDINECYIQKEYAYTGLNADIVPVIRTSSASDAVALKNGTDFEFKRISGPPSGHVLGCCNYTYTITGKGNFCGQVDKVITVTPKDINECYIQKEYAYTGLNADIVPVIRTSSAYDAVALKNGTDFEFKRIGGPPSGHVLGCCSYSYTITGKGNFCGEIKTTITIIPVEIPSSDIAVIKSDKIGFLDKEAGKIRNAVSVKIKFNNKTLVLENGSEFTVTYSDNDNKVTATVELCGNYKGTAYLRSFSYTEPAFVWGRDDFQFSNGANSTGVNYSVSDGILKKMADMFNLTDKEISKLKKYIDEKNKYGMQGRCNGMAETTILSKMGFLKFSDIDSRFSDTPFENPEDYNFISMINFLQASHRFECRYLELTSFENNHIISSQGYYISKILKELETNNSMLKLFTLNESSMHAIVAYAAEPFEYHSNKTGLDYNYRILLYDSNRPVCTGNRSYHETCIYVYKPAQGYDWEYRYEFSSGIYWTNFSDHSDKWIGISDAYKYLSLTDETDILNDKTLIIGDADMDGKITIKDATFIQMYLAEFFSLNDEVQLIAADANHDGYINIKDVLYIQRKIAGLAA